MIPEVVFLWVLLPLLPLSVTNFCSQWTFSLLLRLSVLLQVPWGNQQDLSQVRPR